MSYERGVPRTEQAPEGGRLLDVYEVFLALENGEPTQVSEDMRNLYYLARHGYEEGLAHTQAERVASVLREVQAVGGTEYVRDALAGALRGLRLRESEEMIEAATLIVSLSAAYAGKIYICDEAGDPEVVRGIRVLNDELNVGVITDRGVQALGSTRLYVDVLCLDALTQEAIETFHAEET